MKNKIMDNLPHWRQFHWAEYGAELLGTAFVVFGGLSVVVFDFGKGLPMEHLIPNTSIRLLISDILLRQPYGMAQASQSHPQAFLFQRLGIPLTFAG